MKIPAYDEAYLSMMYTKTRYLFKLIARNHLDVFTVITDYMKSDYRKYMDMGNPLYLNKSPKQILGNMGFEIDAPGKISLDYDEFILEWMADIYTYLQWNYGIYSSDIVAKILPKDLYNKYFPLHEASISNGAEKLKRIYLDIDETR